MAQEQVEHQYAEIAADSLAPYTSLFERMLNASLSRLKPLDLHTAPVRTSSRAL
jgi:hypothetical protein